MGREPRSIEHTFGFAAAFAAFRFGSVDSSSGVKRGVKACIWTKGKAFGHFGKSTGKPAPPTVIAAYTSPAPPSSESAAATPPAGRRLCIPGIVIRSSGTLMIAGSSISNPPTSSPASSSPCSTPSRLSRALRVDRAELPSPPSPSALAA